MKEVPAHKAKHYRGGESEVPQLRTHRTTLPSGTTATVHPADCFAFAICDMTSGKRGLALIISQDETGLSWLLEADRARELAAQIMMAADQIERGE